MFIRKIPKISKIFIRMFKNDKNLIWNNVHNTIFNCNLIIPKSLVDCEIFIYNGKFVETLYKVKYDRFSFRWFLFY